MTIKDQPNPEPDQIDQVPDPSKYLFKVILNQKWPSSSRDSNFDHFGQSQKWPNLTRIGLYPRPLPKSRPDLIKNDQIWSNRSEAINFDQILIKNDRPWPYPDPETSHFLIITALFRARNLSHFQDSRKNSSRGDQILTFSGTKKKVNISPGTGMKTVRLNDIRAWRRTPSPVKRRAPSLQDLGLGEDKLTKNLCSSCTLQ